MRNYYDILEIATDAGYETIKSAYRRLAKRHHPDLGRSCGDEFRVIKEAFDTLSNPQRRHSYDREIGLSRRMTGGGYRDSRVNVSPVVQDVYDDLLDVVTDRFNLPRQRRLIFDLYLSDCEFVNGAQATLSIPQEKICPGCFGFGGSLLHTCRTCGGSGLVDYDIEFDVILKPPLAPGQIYELKRGRNLFRFRLMKGDYIG
jgi:DnaJ-class molecular chaperone